MRSRLFFGLLSVSLLVNVAQAADEQDVATIVGSPSEAAESNTQEAPARPLEDIKVIYVKLPNNCGGKALTLKRYIRSHSQQGDDTFHVPSFDLGSITSCTAEDIAIERGNASVEEIDELLVEVQKAGIASTFGYKEERDCKTEAGRTALMTEYRKQGGIVPACGKKCAENFILEQVCPKKSVAAADAPALVLPGAKAD